jgi:hypothetical protein
MQPPPSPPQTLALISAWTSAPSAPGSRPRQAHCHAGRQGRAERPTDDIQATPTKVATLLDEHAVVVAKLGS